MWSKRDWVLFFAGFEAFHTLSHVVIAYLGTTPIRYLYPAGGWQGVNTAVILVNLAITIALVYWAGALSPQSA